MSESVPASYTRRVGERLRDVRRQQRLSLQAVEAASGQEFRASVLGAYERGERAISVPRMQRLAKFYNVPVDQLLPRDSGPETSWRASDASGDAGVDEEELTGRRRVTIDLVRLKAEETPERELLSRYVSSVQLQRQDFNGQVLTLRSEDLRALACMFGVGTGDMRHRLDELGLRR